MNGAADAAFALTPSPSSPFAVIGLSGVVAFAFIVFAVTTQARRLGAGCGGTHGC